MTTQRKAKAKAKKAKPFFDVRKVDCVKGLQVVAAGSFQTIFADPPYNLGMDYDACEDNQSTADYLDWAATWGQAVYRALSADGTFWLMMGENLASEIDVLMKRIGFRKRSRINWYYTFGVNQKKNFTPSHVALFYYVKGKNFVFNADDPELRIPSARQLVYNDKRANSKGRLPDNTWILRPEQIPEGFNPLGDTWLFSRVCGTFHARNDHSPNQLPVPLVERCLRATTKAGANVCDPFLGTGTTGEAALRLGTAFTGFDVSETCVKNSRARLEAVAKSL